MPKNLQTRFVEALTARGETNEDTKSSKWIRFTRKESGYYFIGKAGSLRFGPNKTHSIPCSSKFKAELLGTLALPGI